MAVAPEQQEMGATGRHLLGANACRQLDHFEDVLGSINALTRWCSQAVPPGVDLLVVADRQGILIPGRNASEGDPRWHLNGYR